MGDLLKTVLKPGMLLSAETEPNGKLGGIKGVRFFLGDNVRTEITSTEALALLLMAEFEARVRNVVTPPGSDAGVLHDQLCDRCVADQYAQLIGVATCRGEYWAMSVAKRCSRRRP